MGLELVSPQPYNFIAPTSPMLGRPDTGLLPTALPLARAGCVRTHSVHPRGRLPTTLHCILS